MGTARRHSDSMEIRINILLRTCAHYTTVTVSHRRRVKTHLCAERAARTRVKIYSYQTTAADLFRCRVRSAWCWCVVPTATTIINLSNERLPVYHSVYIIHARACACERVMKRYLGLPCMSNVFRTVNGHLDALRRKFEIFLCDKKRSATKKCMLLRIVLSRAQDFACRNSRRCSFGTFVIHTGTVMCWDPGRVERCMSSLKSTCPPLAAWFDMKLKLSAIQFSFKFHKYFPKRIFSLD